jgi:hypothetical protein
VPDEAEEAAAVALAVAHSISRAERADGSVLLDSEAFKRVVLLLAKVRHREHIYTYICLTKRTEEEKAKNIKKREK